MSPTSIKIILFTDTCAEINLRLVVSVISALPILIYLLINTLLVFCILIVVSQHPCYSCLVPEDFFLLLEMTIPKIWLL